MEPWFPPLMLLALLLFIFSGYPVAFSLGGVALLFAVIGVQLDLFPWLLLLALPERIFGIMSNYVLLAVPFFIFMGTMLEKSRLAEDLLETIGLLFGPVRGGLALAVVFVGTLLAAATGVIGASVVAMGLISLPVMLRHGYSPTIATGVISASGTLGQIIPPSVVLVVLADQMGVSVGDLFIGALTPGLILAGAFAAYVAGISFFRPGMAPALPRELRNVPPSVLARRVIRVMIPPLALILVVLGSIFAGIATPTEAGALGAFGAILIVMVAGRFSLAGLKDTMESTMRLTAMVLILLIGSTAFALVFRGLGGDIWIHDMLTNLPGGIIGLLIVTNLTIFTLGFFIDFFEIAFIVVPLLTPVFHAMGVDLVWVAIIIGMNLQTSFLTPPFGFALFYLRGVTPPSVKTTDMYRGVIPFIVIQLLVLILVLCFPELVTWMLQDG